MFEFGIVDSEFNKLKMQNKGFAVFCVDSTLATKPHEGLWIINRETSCGVFEGLTDPVPESSVVPANSSDCELLLSPAGSFSAVQNEAPPWPHFPAGSHMQHSAASLMNENLPGSEDKWTCWDRKVDLCFLAVQHTQGFRVIQAEWWITNRLQRQRSQWKQNEEQIIRVLRGGLLCSIYVWRVIPALCLEDPSPSSDVPSAFTGRSVVSRPQPTGAHVIFKRGVGEHFLIVPLQRAKFWDW